MVTSIVSSLCWSHSSRTQCFAFCLNIFCSKFQICLSEQNLLLRSYRGLKRLKNKHKPAASNYALSLYCKLRLKGFASFFNHNCAGAWVLSPPAPSGLRKELFRQNIFVHNPREMNCLCGIYLLVVCTFNVVSSEGVKQDARIFGGYNVDLDSTSKWPWLVAFVTRKNDKFFCAGTLIGRQYVLSGLSSR